jgi:hypothetical protein
MARWQAAQRTSCIAVTGREATPNTNSTTGTPTQTKHSPAAVQRTHTHTHTHTHMVTHSHTWHNADTAYTTAHHSIPQRTHTTAHRAQHTQVCALGAHA